jgi:hypothetical protein
LASLDVVGEPYREAVGEDDEREPVALPARREPFHSPRAERAAMLALVALALTIFVVVLVTMFRPEAR